MSQKKYKLKDILVPTLTLLIICTISALALGFTNNITKSIIANMEQKKLDDAMAIVLPAENYVEIEIEQSKAKLYKAIKDDRTAGYVSSSSETGYGGAVNVMVGIDLTGAVTKVNVVSCDDETPGLGQKIASDDFTNQFKGVSGSVEFGEKVDAITGATISSTAVKNAVNKALELHNKYKIT